MRIRVEAPTAEEARSVLRQVLHEHGDVDLAKARPEGADRLPYPVLRELHAETVDLYERQTERMVDDIVRLLSGSVSKAFGDDNDVEDDDEEQPEPGDVNVETGEVVPDPKEVAEEKEDEEGESDEEG